MENLKESTNIRAYKDGNYIHLIIPYDDSMSEFIQNMIKGGIETLDTELKPTVRIEEPLPELSENAVLMQEDAFVLQGGSYSGMSVDKAMESGAYEAACDIALLWDSIPNESKTTVKQSVITFFKEHMDIVEDVADDFFISLQPVFKESFDDFFNRNKEAIKSMGIDAGSLDDFVYSAPEKTVKKFAVCFVKKYGF